LTDPDKIRYKAVYFTCIGMLEPQFNLIRFTTLMNDIHLTCI